MRKIVEAWIEQVVQFDSKSEYLVYIEELKRLKRKFKEVDYRQDSSGTVTIRVRKQYNSNNFPV